MILRNYNVLLKKRTKIFEYCILINQNGKKIFLKRMLNYDKNIISLFENEISKYNYIIQRNKKINIANIVSYKYNYIIYDYIEGKKLTEIPSSKINDILVIYLKICEQVKQIHNLNLVHGDLKLSNILIKNDNAYIIDYGACAFIGEKIAYGSKTYCSVEQLKRLPATYKFDIYSLGVILYRLIENRMPYKEFTNITQLINQKQLGFPHLTNTDINYINVINNLIQKMTMGNISLDEVTEEIKRIINYIGVD